MSREGAALPLYLHVISMPTMDKSALGSRMRRTSRPLVVVLFGPPGSGKSTQAILLERALGFVRISPGDILRSHVAAGDALGSEFARIMRTGQLVPDEIINRMITERIAEPDCADGFILDGYPRTHNQCEVLIRVLRQINCDAVVIKLALDTDIAVARLSGRLECKTCGELYHLASRRPKVAGVCDADGSGLTVRIDDRDDAIRTRLSAYEAQTEPALRLLSEFGYDCHVVRSGSALPEVTAGEIAECLRRSTARGTVGP